MRIAIILAVALLSSPALADPDCAEMRRAVEHVEAQWQTIVKVRAANPQYFTGADTAEKWAEAEKARADAWARYARQCAR